MPDKVVKVEENRDVVQILTCDSPFYSINSNYEAGEIQRLIIRKYNEPNTTEENTDNSSNETDTTSEEIAATYEKLRFDGRASFEQSETNSLLSLDFTVYLKSDFDIDNFVLPPDTQLKYYQEQGLSCILRTSS